MASKKVHINQHNIKANAKAGNKRLPVISVKEGSSNTYGNEVDIEGPCRVIYSPDKPLSCGAKVWIETDSEVDIRQRKSKGRALGDSPEQRENPSYRDDDNTPVLILFVGAALAYFIFKVVGSGSLQGKPQPLQLQGRI